MVPDYTDMAESLSGTSGSPSSSSAGGDGSGSGYPQSYKLYMGDTQGALKVIKAPLPSRALDPPPVQVPVPRRLNVQGLTQNADRAVQKMAEGVIQDGSWAIAIARKDGTINVVVPSSTADDEGTEDRMTDDSESAKVVMTIHEKRMRAGVERWVGLAISESGVYSCTSSGAFRFSPFEGQSAASPVELELPGPLQHLIFYPPLNPEYFFYGGEEIPLSLWDVEVAMSPAPSGNEVAPSDSRDDQDANGVAYSSKMKKRKRQAELKAKAKELMWGEVWRAKNLPNDTLSLPQRANITSIVIVSLCFPSQKTTPKGASEGSTDEKEPTPLFTVAVGTRDGLIRMYETPGRSHRSEFRVIPQGQGAVKTLEIGTYCGDDPFLFAADTAGKLYAADQRTGKVMYQYNDITGAISALMPLLPASRHAKSQSIYGGRALLFSASLDRQLRLHTTEGRPDVRTRHYQPRVETIWAAFTGGPAVTAVVWNRILPVVSPVYVEGRDDEDEDEDEDGEGGGGGKVDTEALWDSLAPVGAAKVEAGKNARASAGAKDENENGEDEADVDEEAAKEARIKRAKGQN